MDHSSETGNTNAQKRTDISDEQKDIIRQYIARGLTGTSRKVQHLLKEAIQKTGLPADVVRRLIYNIQRKKQPVKRLGTNKSIYGRRLSGYNLFCSEIGSKSSIAGNRQKTWSRLWAAVPEPEKDVYCQRARKINATPLCELKGIDRQAAIDASTKAITKHMDKLDQMQPAHGLFIFTDTKQDYVSATCGNGSNVLTKKETELQTELATVRENIPRQQSSEERRGGLRQVVRNKVGLLYGHFRGFDGPRQFPYTANMEGKTDFIVHGLPEGFVLRMPSNMIKEELQTVYNSDLSFTFKETGSDNGSQLTAAVPITMPESSSLPESVEQVTMDECLPGPELFDDVPMEEEDIFPESTLVLSTDDSSSTISVSFIQQSQDNTDPENVVSVPHQSTEEALASAKRLQENIMNNPYGTGKCALEALLGKRVSQQWEMNQPGLLEWFDGTVVEKRKGHYGIHFDGDKRARNLSAQRIDVLLKSTTFRVLN